MKSEQVAMAERLLVEIDRIARDYDHYEYGLPVYSDDLMARMVAVLVPHITLPTPTPEAG